MSFELYFTCHTQSLFEKKKNYARGINHKENTQLTAVNTTELKQEAS